MNRTILTTILSMLAPALIAQLDCSNALPLSAGTHVVDQIEGIQAPEPICIGDQVAAKGNWFSYTPTVDQSLSISTDLPENAGIDTRFHVYTGNCGTLVCVAGDDDSGSGWLSTAVFNVTAGTSYLIAFDDRWDDSGFVFQLQEGPTLVDALTFTQQQLPVTGNVMCIVDMNGDHLDDIVRVSTTSITILYQDEPNVWTATVIPTDTVPHMPSWSIAAGDLDGNGFNDLLYGGGQGTTFMIANDNGTGYTMISGPEYVFSQRTNFVDIDNDGHLDAFVCHDVDPNVFYMNDGTGSVTFNQGGLGDVEEGGNYGSIWIDHDNDGDLDLFLSKCRGGNTPAKINELHENNGDGTYTEVAAQYGLDDPMQTWSSAWGDFDNDGDLDIFIGVSSFTDGGHKLLRNDGNGVYTDITAGSGFDQILTHGNENITHDFNNDGYLDIFGAGGTMMMNNGDMTFSPAVVPMGHGPVGDINNDGFLDIVRFNTAYLNGPNGNNWLKVNTVGTASNMNGIGARITITSALGSQIREIRSGDGFAFMSSLNAHFGLDSDDLVEELVVQWPSGTIDTLSDLPANSTITIVEGSTIGSGLTELPSPDLLIYPSPAKDVLFFRSDASLRTALVTVVDLEGRMVLQERLTDDHLSIASISTGAYLVQVITQDGKFSHHRFVKE